MRAPRPAAGQVVELRSCVYRRAGFTLGPVSLEIGAGVVHGLVGPDGNGKTTLVDLVLGRLQPLAGTVRVLGQRPGTDAPEGLEAAEGLDLDAVPGGAAGAVGQPRVIVLDDPTAGLDPRAAAALGELLGARALAGAAVLVATADLAWAERFTDVITLVRSGVVSAARPTGRVARSHGPVDGLGPLDGFRAAAESLVGERDPGEHHPVRTSGPPVHPPLGPAAGPGPDH